PLLSCEHYQVTSIGKSIVVLSTEHRIIEGSLWTRRPVHRVATIAVARRWRGVRGNPGPVTSVASRAPGKKTPADVLRPANRRTAPLPEPTDPRHPRDGHGRRSWRALEAPPRGSLQAGDALRGQVPHHRFRPVELRQFRDPPDLGADAIQGALADSAHPARLGLSAGRVRRVRRDRSRAARSEEHT